MNGNQYNQENSSTYEDLDAEVEVEFGSGIIDGLLATETFYVNDMEIPEVIFIEITNENGDVFQNVFFYFLFLLSNLTIFE